MRSKHMAAPEVLVSLYESYGGFTSHRFQYRESYCSQVKSEHLLIVSADHLTGIECVNSVSSVADFFD